MSRAKAKLAQPPEEFVRFSLSQRAEHFVMMISFTTLVVTGLPQKFFSDGWAQTLIMALGGIETVRLVHRAFAALFCLQGLYHVGQILNSVANGSFSPSMIPGVKDVRDALNTFKYCIGTSSVMPRFGRFDYRQKFEYWGVVLGCFVMAGTGLVLMFPAQATRLLPGAFIPAAKEMHGGEALTVLLVVVIWHLYGAHFNPLRFPGDTSIFTGKISRERMMKEHPLEYARIISRLVENVREVPPVVPAEKVATMVEEDDLELALAASHSGRDRNESRDADTARGPEGGC